MKLTGNITLFLFLEREVHRQWFKNNWICLDFLDTRVEENKF